MISDLIVQKETAFFVAVAECLAVGEDIKQCTEVFDFTTCKRVNTLPHVYDIQICHLFIVCNKG